MNKLTIITIVSALVGLSKAECWSESQGYKCCTGCEVFYEDDSGQWGVENDEWCGIDDAVCNPSPSNDAACWSLPDYPCCKESTEVVYTDGNGDWSVEDGDWCGIIKSSTPSTTKKEESSKTTTKKPTKTESSSQTVLYPEYEEMECTPPDEFSYGQCCHGEDIKAYGKCGGKEWTGSTCCMVGTRCKEVNEWVSLCEPDPTAPIRPAVHDVGVHGKPWCKPPNCVVTEDQGGYRWGYDVVTDSGCEIPEYECYDLINKTWGPQEYPVGTEEGITTRYYDCCKPSCSWPGKAEVTQPVRQCAVDGKTLLTDFSAPSACQTDVEGISHMCEDQQPWAVSDVLSYGFAAAALPGGESESCCACYAITFSEPPIRGKQIVVQVTNTGADVGSNQFDLQIPGGGVGIFDACTNMYGLPAGSNGWGKKYGGVSSIEDCDSFPEALQAGCRWRFEFLLGADNPKMTFVEVECPKVLTDITGCIRK
ncbi:hypothetical protein LY90DRAFT_460043 [Neocallimastix californiae]|jgi:hypothetical protein|uniref:Cellulase n=1 Tax=Neocallimastix californiae TaxID=1754190 RepID=A0A1Y2BF31_9FUNG|nr:hypothetical protein LY90DRAFT_460043 [Neocallimastix californiae]|eukprot:ORY33316.1 hypothetical protein LY90DRAFT_460043 [Neocallimastix californiae]